MVASIFEPIHKYWNQWTTGRKIGLTYGVNPYKEGEKERGGTFYQFPIIECSVRKTCSVSEYPLEFGKIYNDNMVKRGAILECDVFFTNGYVSQLATDALLTIGTLTDSNVITNTIFEGLELLKKLVEEPIFCDVTTNIHFIQNLKLISYEPQKETAETGRNTGKVHCVFQEMLFFKPVEFEVTKEIVANSVVQGDAKKTARAKKAVSEQSKKKLKQYTVLAGGENFMCKAM